VDATAADLVVLSTREGRVVGIRHCCISLDDLQGDGRIICGSRLTRDSRRVQTNQGKGGLPRPRLRSPVAQPGYSTIGAATRSNALARFNSRPAG